MANIVSHNPPRLFPPYAGYAHASRHDPVGAGMSYEDLVSLRFFLASATDDPANVALIREHLGDHRCCRTVVVQQLLEPEWLVEIEAIAAKVE